MDKEKVQQEILPAGIVTMLFAEYKRIISRQERIIVAMLATNIGLIALLVYELLKR